MPTFQTYNVTPILPATLEPLREMSFNLWWTWEPSARRLFRHLDPELWDRTNHNPIRMLQLSRQSRLDRKSTRLNSSHVRISYAVFCLKKKKPIHRKLTLSHIDLV